ncbi:MULTISPECIES: hypothetical protein [unclassified Mucilaginibacter]|uniref:hypothetical protein n=1 Tax=unclassified Mucilaginibacter TaxID=2617802 RepID=UPI002AC91FC3|nr:MULTISPECIES: hypothetical protein [unclassified Mucilaginibacter]MEB0248848.1 hypothetical protein [Mucilaginibacter sp. 5B2]MEB0263170.1 hypothetical protein [Mucilaginibacter sp. 10I4]MEB0278140.1 hypothetical protein [Mucilaginibacter sp. 10B2]MEB0301374.1 hypothetical protein [Mucilaginibacter sp. 5C4]WPX23052.1 hypothetical protein RHM67_17370 [Mucilaginibacter sp. 5C4]
MKTILIPTDYQATSLDSIHAICRQFKNEELNFVFVHVFKLSDSYSDLLMLSRRSREYEKVSDEFYRYCNVLRAQYPHIQNIKIDFLYGGTLSMFKDFIEDNDVDMVLESDSYTFTPIHQSSVDPGLLIKRSGLPVINVPKGDYAKMMGEQKAAVPAQQHEELLEV